MQFDEFFSRIQKVEFKNETILLILKHYELDKQSKEQTNKKFYEMQNAEILQKPRTKIKFPWILVNKKSEFLKDFKLEFIIDSFNKRN